MAYKIIDRTTAKDGMQIQLEDWSESNTEKFPDLYGYTIAAYPIAQKTSKSCFITGGKEFRLAICHNSYNGYVGEHIKRDYEALKNGSKTFINNKSLVSK